LACPQPSADGKRSPGRPRIRSKRITLDPGVWYGV
jgi:hypothetical protein